MPTGRPAEPERPPHLLLWASPRRRRAAAAWSPGPAPSSPLCSLPRRNRISVPSTRASDAVHPGPTTVSLVGLSPGLDCKAGRLLDLRKGWRSEPISRSLPQPHFSPSSTGLRGGPSAQPSWRLRTRAGPSRESSSGPLLPPVLAPAAHWLRAAPLAPREGLQALLELGCGEQRGAGATRQTGADGSAGRTATAHNPRSESRRPGQLREAPHDASQRPAVRSSHRHDVAQAGGTGMSCAR